MSEESSMDIDYVANLARIKLTAEERQKFQGQLGDVLKYFEKLEFEHFYIQPLDNLRLKRNTKMAISYVLNNPKWKLSIQSHKYLGIM